MAQVTADMVKKLRETTGAPMGKCKEALDAVGGDIEQAVAHLRKAGIASAVKKEGRETKEGTIAAFEGTKAVAVVEVNAETDFVAKNDIFQKFVKEVAEEIAVTGPVSLDALLNQPFSQDTGLTIDQYRAVIIQKIGENIRVNRFELVGKGPDRSVAAYTHMGGKIVTLVVLEGASGEEALAKDIAMHVAAEAPQYLVPEDVPASVKASEEEIARAQVKGKPDNIADKIIAGKLNAFYDQFCLMRQKYIKDSSLSIAALVEKRSKEIGKPLKVSRFIRWQIGQS